MADQSLVDMVRTKYPGVYDDLSDVALDMQVRAKYPGVYDDLAKPTANFKTTNEPPSAGLKAVAYGKDAMSLALDALPGAGAVVGGALATPETAGAGTLAGAALGAGAGRGLRDLIKAGLGLEKPTTAVREGGRIALDAGETYVAGKVLPALFEAIKKPGATVADVYEGVRQLNNAMPKLLKFSLPKLPSGVGKAPASVLEGRASQSWEQFLREGSENNKTMADVYSERPAASAQAQAAAPVASAAVAPPEPAVAPTQQAATFKPGVSGKFTAAEVAQGMKWKAAGVSDAQILERIEASRAFNAAAGLTPPTVAQTKFPKGMRGGLPR